MGMMARMRNLAPWFIVTVGALFILFMVLSDAKITEIFRNQNRIVGTVDGKEISYKDFAKRVEFERTNMEKQGRKIEESQMADFRDQVWDAMLNEMLIQKKIKEFGIDVTDQEIADQLLGPNPPQFVKQYFIDSTGAFNRQAYDQAIRDPKNKDAVLQLEDMVRRQVTQQKLTDYLYAAVNVSEDEVKQNFIDNNITMAADYVAVPFTTVPDSMVKLTPEYEQEYYNKNIHKFHVPDQRKIAYVMFPLKPSKDDTTETLKSLSDLVSKLHKDTTSFKTYVGIYSDKPYSKDTVAITKISPEVQNAIIKAKAGSVIGPILTREGAVVYHLIKTVKAKEPVVRASHILIKTVPGKEAEAKKEANSLYRELRKGADFAKMAREKSADKGSAVRGGDLGWFEKGQMVKPFEKAAFSGRVGRVLKPIKTRFGYHIIKVTGKLKKNFVVEKLVDELKPSPTTQDFVYNKASDFAYLAKKNDFDNEAKLVKYKIVMSRPFSKDAKTIPGLGSNGSIVQFAFNNSVGTVSDVFKIPSGYVVFKIAEKTEAGNKPFKEVERQIKRMALTELKLEKTLDVAKQIRDKIGTSGDLNVAKQIWPSAKVGKISNIKPGNNIPTIGREFAFSEYALTAPLNKLSEPIKGNRASYLVKVVQRTPFDSNAYSIQRNSIFNNLMRTKQRDFLNQWIKSIREEATIVDNRYKFYK
jgi:peptidyl-prolyl cis-trans isomerase D